MNQLKIGIVGGGIAGSAAAHFLAKQGHSITVFEREATPKPIGAGIMLQPTGYKIMSLLGFQSMLDTNSNKIYRFQGISEGKKVIDIDFQSLFPEACGRGVHRGLLFSTLINSLEMIPNVTLLTDMEVEKVNQSATKAAIQAGGEEFTGFDLVIISNGSRSLLRDSFKVTKKSKQQPVSALWATVPYREGELDEKVLRQHYNQGVLTGMMPIGINPLADSSSKIVNFFWGVNQQENPIRSASDFTKMKTAVNTIYGDSSILDRIESKEQLTFAPYFDSQLSAYFEGRVAFIGDVAHAMSPQLSSGTNLALLDTYMLSECLEEGDDLLKSLKVFSDKRIKQVHYYQQISRIVTPIFQGNKDYSFLRDKIMQQLYNLPVSRNLLLSTLMGIRNGWFSNLEKRYYI